MEVAVALCTHCLRVCLKYLRKTITPSELPVAQPIFDSKEYAAVLLRVDVKGRGCEDSAEQVH